MQSIGLSSPIFRSDRSDRAIHGNNAPNDIDSVLWSLSSPVERQSLLKASAASGAEGEEGGEAVVTGEKPREVDPNSGGDAGSGTGTGSGGVSGGGQSSGSPKVPPGFERVGDGTKYMRGPDGKLHLVPEWEQRVANGSIDLWCVAKDLAFITASSLTAVLTGPAQYASGALAAGLEALDETQQPSE